LIDVFAAGERGSNRESGKHVVRALDAEIVRLVTLIA
jgi:hypothetical protein